MSSINLDECKLITSEQYCELVNPVFIGQTKLDDNGGYYMAWKSNDILYKTYQEALTFTSNT